MKTCPIILAIITLLATPAHAKEIPQKVDEALGRELIHIAVGPPKRLIEPGTNTGGDADPKFLIYMELGKNADTIGWFAVNRWTGDVWNTMAGDQCIHYDNSVLREALNNIKARLNQEELQEYKRLSELRPTRISDLEPCSG